jgi:endonuclease/exonuclease/phosphatase family metal-dependent hydrolase
MALTLATFNVKNLLDHDERARAILPGKLDWIARRLADCDADIVGLQEIGSRALVDELAARLPGYRNAGTSAAANAIVGSADARGIRCALLSRLPIAEARVHTTDALTFPVFREGDPQPFGARIPLRRGIVHARAAAPGLGDVEVLVAHFKSVRPVPLRDAAGNALEARTPRARAEGELRAVVWRVAEALHLRGIVDGILAANPGARVAVVGDLNDTPGSATLSALQGREEGSLLDCTAGVPPASRFSVLHEGRRNQIDHVLTTSSLYGRLRAARFLTGELREHPSTQGADEAPTLDSDHAPLVVHFA